VPNIPSVKYSPPKVTEGDIETLFGSFKFMRVDFHSSL
jgi:hypothetical protein